MWRERRRARSSSSRRAGRPGSRGAARSERSGFLLAACSGPGLDYPLPVVGVQGQTSTSAGANEQLRMLIGGVTQRRGWTVRRGQTELTLRGFVQLLAFENSYFEAGEEVEGEAVKTSRSGSASASARPFGPVRSARGRRGLPRSRAPTTRDDFVVPNDTFEGVVRLEATAPLARQRCRRRSRGGKRFDWQPWGLSGGEALRDEWRRWRLAVVHETTPFPLAKLHLDAQLPRRRRPRPLLGLHARRASPGCGCAASPPTCWSAERVAAVAGSLALPLSRRVRGEIGIGAAWARDEESGYDAEPLAGVGVGVSVRGRGARSSRPRSLTRC